MMKSDDKHQHDAPSSSPRCDTKYLPLLDIVERMKVYVQEAQYVLPSYDGASSPEQCKEAARKVLENARKKHIKLVDELLAETQKLVNGSITPDSYLCHLLKIRSKYLLDRAEPINSTLDHSINTSSPSILPTGQALFNFLMESDSTSRDYQESVRIAAVHRYELLNLLIRESFALCALDDLQPRTLNLLRSAVQLHPILIGERQDLGHPDETNFYGLLETIVIPPIPSEKPDKAPKKCPLSALHRLANNLRREHPKLDINYLRAIIHTLNMTEKEGVRASFSRVQENLEVQILLAHFTKKFVQFKNLGTP